MGIHDQNLRLILRSQDGVRDLAKSQPARASIPGQHSGNARVIGHMVQHDSTLLIRPVSNQPNRYFDGSKETFKNCTIDLSARFKTEETKPVVAEPVEENLQGFTQRTQLSALSPFANIGIITEDEGVVADEEGETSEDGLDAETTRVVLQAKTPKSFGVSKEELSAFRLTVRQVKDLYKDVTGKQPTNISTGKCKARIRATAGNSFADYMRFLQALDKVLM